LKQEQRSEMWNEEPSNKGQFSILNSSVADTLGPAAQALVQAGLFTPDQLTSLGAVLTSVQPAPAGQVNNDLFYNANIRASMEVSAMSMGHRRAVSLLALARDPTLFHLESGEPSGSGFA